ncbi:MAG: hypothetical protein AAB214_00385, partial [Fibrobacterota bacterium]
MDAEIPDLCVGWEFAKKIECLSGVWRVQLDFDDILVGAVGFGQVGGGGGPKRGGVGWQQLAKIAQQFQREDGFVALQIDDQIFGNFRTGFGNAVGAGLVRGIGHADVGAADAGGGAQTFVVD